MTDPAPGAALLEGATPYVCECGAKLTPIRSGGDEWGWRDENGDTEVPMRWYPAVDIIYKLIYRIDGHSWQGLAEAFARGEGWATMYSNLDAAYGLSGIPYHFHRNRTEWHGDPPPECCGLPKRLAPSGWVCRKACHLPPPKKGNRKR